MKELVRDIWNELIAKPKNRTGHFQMSPKKLQDIVERHLGKEEKPIQHKPFQVGVTYDTKWQTKERFTIKEIKYKFDKELQKDVPYYFNGIIKGREHLGLCPVNVDRLIKETY